MARPSAPPIDTATVSETVAYSHVPPGTPIRVQRWDGPHAQISYPRAGCVVFALVSRETAEQRLLESRLRDRGKHDDFQRRVIRCHRWMRAVTERNLRPLASGRTPRRSAPRRRGSRRRTCARAGPSDPGEPEPPRRRRPGPTFAEASPHLGRNRACDEVGRGDQSHALRNARPRQGGWREAN